ncbi:unnamed protein product [Sphagnum jensenii]|uniref:Glycosyltransferase family 28 N-terminal domain-containing protein n=1 Tax=Sphagnum jensenii TaxID=128206 RepID=A0ABP1AEX0_9BRYO
MSLGGSLTGNDEKATTTTMKNKVNENLNFLLPATPGTTTPPQVCHPLQQSKSEHLLHHEKNLKGLLLLAPRNEQQNNNSNSDVEHMLLETQSLPVWMPSVVTSTTVVNANVKQNFASKISNPSLQQLRLDIAKLDGVETGEQSVTTDQKLCRAKSMSSMQSPDAGKSISSVKHRGKKSQEHANLRKVEEKLTDRKKEKLMRKLTTVQQDGIVDFDIEGSPSLAQVLFESETRDEIGQHDELGEEDEDELQSIPPLKIVMLIVGTRGDVQPFIGIGRKLQEYGHQVRLASHANFRDFVKTAGLEFYPLGGDPKILAQYMVKNKGFLPTGAKEVAMQREQIKSIVYSLLAPCTEPDLDSGVPFRANVIIANPPAYGHVHVAEYLKVPLHLYFTMPWTPTSAFPHPLSRVNTPAAYKLSYQVVDTLIWLGIRGIINDFRKKELKLRPITYLSGSQASISNLPTGYLWSPHIVPKPKDWGPLIDIVGYCFLNLAEDYKPPEDLVKWLASGTPPIYIGFGSLPVGNPDGMTNIIVEALQKTNQRGLINQGWGGMGQLPQPPKFVYLLQDCPHDWLFPQCAAVVHHGGAGTTAASLRAACPTTVVPFFGDQPFWGSHVHARGVGPVPIPVNEFSLEKLVAAIHFMLNPEVKRRATELAEAMADEDGVQGAVDVFHKHIRKFLPDIMHSTTTPPSDSPALRRRNKSFLKSCWSCGSSKLKTSV